MNVVGSVGVVLSEDDTLWLSRDKFIPDLLKLTDFYPVYGRRINVPIENYTRRPKNRGINIYRYWRVVLSIGP